MLQLSLKLSGTGRADAVAQGKSGIAVPDLHRAPGAYNLWSIVDPRCDCETEHLRQEPLMAAPEDEAVAQLCGGVVHDYAAARASRILSSHSRSTPSSSANTSLIFS